MKHLKTFEILSDSDLSELEVGDYVLIKDTTFSGRLKDFVTKTPGKVTNITYVVDVLYDNIPDDIKHLILMRNIITYRIYDIEVFSKNKEELETLVNQNKYNV